MGCDRVVMTFLSPDASGIEVASLRFYDVTNHGRRGLAVKTFGLAIRSSLLHLSRLDLDQAAPVTPVYVPSEQAREEEARVDWDEEQRKNQQAVIASH